MTHKKEIIKWANYPDGTAVWYQLKNSKGWAATTSPAWHDWCKYVVDDDFANVRKAFMDGEKIQQNIQWNSNCPETFTKGWHDYNTDDPSNINGSHNGTEVIYRIKPKTVYKYQMLYKVSSHGPYVLTDTFYEAEEDFTNFLSDDMRCVVIDVERLEMSKMKFNNE